MVMTLTLNPKPFSGVTLHLWAPKRESDAVSERGKTFKDHDPFKKLSKSVVGFGFRGSSRRVFV